MRELRHRKVIPAEPACVFLAGSLVRGWGNATSDLDIYVISDEAWTGEYVEVSSVSLVIGTVPANSFYVGDRRWDLEYWHTAQIEQLLDEVSWAHHDSGALRDRSFNGYEVNVIERIAYGLPVAGAEWLAACQQRLKESALPTHLVTQRLHLTDTFVEDAVGQLQAQDYQSAVLSARRAFGCAVDALMASCGEFGAKMEWRARRFKTVRQDVLSFEDYWRIETMASYTERRPAAWVEEVLEACRRLAMNIEL